MVLIGCRSRFIPSSVHSGFSLHEVGVGSKNGKEVWVVRWGGGQMMRKSQVA